MFNIFNKKKKKEYPITEIELHFFKNLIAILPNKYHYLLSQINDDFLIAFKENVIGFKDSYTFLLNAKLEFKYINKTLPHFFIVQNIKIWNTKANDFESINLNILSGYLGGFNIKSTEFLNFDLTKFDISEINEKYFENEDLEKILKSLNEVERKIVKENIGNTYEIKLKEGKFYFFDDLTDGDLIAVDVQMNAYILTHDPFKIIKIYSKNTFIVALQKGNLKEEILKNCKK